MTTTDDKPFTAEEARLVAEAMDIKPEWKSRCSETLRAWAARLEADERVAVRPPPAAAAVGAGELKAQVWHQVVGPWDATVDVLQPATALTDILERITALVTRHADAVRREALDALRAHVERDASGAESLAEEYADEDSADSDVWTGEACAYRKVLETIDQLARTTQDGER